MSSTQAAFQEQFDDIGMSVQPSMIITPGSQHPLSYPAIALSNEVGEVNDRIKKIIRDRNGLVRAEDSVAIIKELGDCVWYIGLMAAVLNCTCLLYTSPSPRDS